MRWKSQLKASFLLAAAVLLFACAAPEEVDASLEDGLRGAESSQEGHEDGEDPFGEIYRAGTPMICWQSVWLGEGDEAVGRLLAGFEAAPLPPMVHEGLLQHGVAYEVQNVRWDRLHVEEGYLWLASYRFDLLITTEDGAATVLQDLETTALWEGHDGALYKYSYPLWATGRFLIAVSGDTASIYAFEDGALVSKTGLDFALYRESSNYLLDMAYAEEIEGIGLVVLVNCQLPDSDMGGWNDTSVLDPETMEVLRSTHSYGSKKRDAPHLEEQARSLPALRLDDSTYVLNIETYPFFIVGMENGIPVSLMGGGYPHYYQTADGTRLTALEIEGKIEPPQGTQEAICVVLQDKEDVRYIWAGDEVIGLDLSLKDTLGYFMPFITESEDDGERILDYDPASKLFRISNSYMSFLVGFDFIENSISLEGINDLALLQHPETFMADCTPDGRYQLWNVRYTRSDDYCMILYDRETGIGEDFDAIYGIELGFIDGSRIYVKRTKRFVKSKPTEYFTIEIYDLATGEQQKAELGLESWWGDPYYKEASYGYDPVREEHLVLFTIDSYVWNGWIEDEDVELVGLAGRTANQMGQYWGIAAVNGQGELQRIYCTEIEMDSHYRTRMPLIQYRDAGYWIYNATNGFDEGGGSYFYDPNTLASSQYAGEEYGAKVELVAGTEAGMKEVAG